MTSPSYAKAVAEALARAKEGAAKATQIPRWKRKTDYYVLVSFTEKEHDKLHWYAEKLGCSVGDLAESAIRLYLEGRLGHTHDDMVKRLMATMGEKT